MKQVKGTLVKLMVKAIRANKTGIYDKLLSDDAKKLINQKILDSTWYPYDPYKECNEALIKVEANNDPEILHQWGKKYGEVIFTSIYKAQAHGENMKNAIENYRHFIKLAFNFSEIVPEYVADNQVKITFKDFDPDWENFYYLALGWVQKFIELSIKNNEIISKIIKKSWKGEGATQMLFSLST